MRNTKTKTTGPKKCAMDCQQDADGRINNLRLTI